VPSSGDQLALLWVVGRLRRSPCICALGLMWLASTVQLLERTSNTHFSRYAGSCRNEERVYATCDILPVRLQRMIAIYPKTGRWQDLCRATKAGGLSMSWHCFVVMSLAPISLVAREGFKCVVRVVQDASGLPHPFPQYKGSNPVAVVMELERQALHPLSTLLDGIVCKNITSLFSTSEEALKQSRMGMGCVVQASAESAHPKTEPSPAVSPRSMLCLDTLGSELT
jgi:hypothetical protein